MVQSSTIFQTKLHQEGFEFWKTITEFAATTTTSTLPPEYKLFLVYNLAISIAEDWDRIISPTLYDMAKRSYEIVDKAGALSTPPTIAGFEFRPGYPGNRFITGIYNINTDE